MRKAILTKPLDGKPEGEAVEFSNADFDMLEKLGAVRAADDEAEAEAPAPEQKAEDAPANKAEPAPANKSAPAKKAK